MVQVPVPLNIVTVALVTPPATLGVPSEQTPVLLESTDNVTVSLGGGFSRHGEGGVVARGCRRWLRERRSSGSSGPPASG